MTFIARSSASRVLRPLISATPPYRPYSSGSGNMGRTYSEQPVDISEQPIAVVAGAGAKTARAAIGTLLKSGIRVIALTGQDMKERVEGLHIKPIDRSRFADPVYIAASIREALAEMDVSSAPQIIGINLIGTSVAPKGSTLMEINHDIPISFFEGLLEAVQDKTDRISLGHISSIAITMNGDNDCSYVDSKKKAEESLFQLNPKGTVVSFRPGIICPTPGLQYDTTHDYSIEQLARLPIIPVLGSGQQIMQPVAEDCLYKALTNALVAEEVIREIVNAVGSDALTQKELFAYFAPQENPGFIHIPTDFAAVVARHFPKGRIAPYAVRLFNELDTNPEKNQPICGERFTQLLGKKPIGLRELYKKAIIVTRPAPFGEHIMEMIRSPREALSVAAAAVTSAKDFYFSSSEKR